METEARTTTLIQEVYWVIDGKGVRHLYCDRLAAQAAEERYQRERKEME
jgi:hypothetical protein